MSANTPLISCQVLSSDYHCFKPAIVSGAIGRSGQYFHLPPPWVSTPTRPPCHLHWQCVDQSLQLQFCLPHISCLAPKIKAKNPIISYSFESCSITSINIAIVQYTKLATIDQEQDQVSPKKKKQSKTHLFVLWFRELKCVLLQTHLLVSTIYFVATGVIEKWVL